ncbi:MAG: hypothetical protein JWN93_1833 [Hyphomicrobiales bacterium]|nr:hypothetical protein [Hyphomicrobiales bacterium]
MANANRKKMGKGAQGKGAGVGALTEAPKEMIGENMTLSNRDKSRHADERGLDSRAVMNEQGQDHAGARDAESRGAKEQS